MKCAGLSAVVIILAVFSIRGDQVAPHASWGVDVLGEPASEARVVRTFSANDAAYRSPPLSLLAAFGILSVVSV